MTAWRVFAARHRQAQALVPDMRAAYTKTLTRSLDAQSATVTRRLRQIAAGAPNLNPPLNTLDTVTAGGKKTKSVHLRSSEVFMGGLAARLAANLGGELDQHAAEYGTILLGSAAAYGAVKTIPQVLARQAAALPRYAADLGAGVDELLDAAFTGGATFGDLIGSIGDWFTKLGGAWADRVGSDLAQQTSGGITIAGGTWGSITATKGWQDQGDDRVRDGHHADEVDPVAIGDPFIVNDEELMYPGDDNGSDFNVRNCRCETVISGPDGEPLDDPGADQEALDSEMQDAENSGVLSSGRAVAFDWDEDAHPRDAHGRFGEGGLDLPPTTTKGLRDQLVGRWTEKFKADAVPYAKAYDAARAAGEPTPPPQGLAEVAVWRDGSGLNDKYTQALVNYALRGDTRALGTIRANGTRVASEYHVEAVRPEYAAAAQQAIKDFNADPKMAELLDRYGAPGIALAATDRGVALNSLDTPSGRYDESDRHIMLFDSAWGRVYGDGGKGNTPYAARDNIKPGQALTSSSDSIGGVLAHEFGHHVENSLTDEQRDEWRGIYNERHSEYERSGHPSEPGGISYYAMRDNDRPAHYEKEGFAETFATVTAPGYSRDLYDASYHPMLGWMERLVGGKP